MWPQTKNTFKSPLTVTGESAETLTKSRHFVLRVFLLTANFQQNFVTGADNKRSPLSSLLTTGITKGAVRIRISAVSTFFETFGSALVPSPPRTGAAYPAVSLTYSLPIREGGSKAIIFRLAPPSLGDQWPLSPWSPSIYHSDVSTIGK